MIEIILLSIILWGFETLLVWDYINQLAGFNESLENCDCEWRRKKIEHVSLFFPKKDKRLSVKKVTPQYLYLIIFLLEIVIYICYFLSILNFFCSIIIKYVIKDIDLVTYIFLFTFIDILVMGAIVLIAYMVVNKKLANINKNWKDFK